MRRVLSTFCARLFAAAVLLTAGMTFLAFSQSFAPIRSPHVADRITQPINEGQLVALPGNTHPSARSKYGTVYVTLYSLVGGQWLSNAYTYTAFSATSGLAVMQTPTPGSTLSGNAATFTWSAGNGATAYWLDIGSSPGGNQYYQSGNLGNVLTTMVFSLPADGSTIYVTLYSLVGGQWLSNSYTYVSGP